jgi:hypothetical protein
MEQWLVMLVSYGVGTLAGIWLFRRAVLEHTIVQTIDNLVKNDYARSFTNDEGEVELYKWYDLDDVIEEMAMAMENEKGEVGSEEDDTA